VFSLTTEGVESVNEIWKLVNWLTLTNYWERARTFMSTKLGLKQYLSIPIQKTSELSIPTETIPLT
jgi:hypothetical protein